MCMVFMQVNLPVMDAMGTFLCFWALRQKIVISGDHSDLLVESPPILPKKRKHREHRTFWNPPDLIPQVELQGGSLTYHYHSCDDHASTKIYNKWSVTFHEDVVSVGDVFVFCPWKIKVISKQSWSLKFLLTEYVYLTWLTLCPRMTHSHKNLGTRQKTNMEPGNRPLENEIPFGN